jgi:hypothetical protein
VKKKVIYKTWPKDDEKKKEENPSRPPCTLTKKKKARFNPQLSPLLRLLELLLKIPSLTLPCRQTIIEGDPTTRPETIQAPSSVPGIKKDSATVLAGHQSRIHRQLARPCLVRNVWRLRTVRRLRAVRRLRILLWHLPVYGGWVLELWVVCVPFPLGASRRLNQEHTRLTSGRE